MRDLFSLVLVVLLTAVHTNGQILNRELSLKQPDSMTIVQSDDLYSERLERLDSLNSFYHRHDPVKKQGIPDHNLGNLGSAVRHSLFKVEPHLGFQPGYHQYDTYKHRIDEFRFFTSDISFTDLNYSQGLTQEEGIFNARFRRSFSEGAHISLDYLRINQIGQFAHQRAKHTGFGVGVFYNAPSQKYRGLFLYQSNSIVQEDNGGIKDYNLLQQDMVPQDEPAAVFLLNGMTVNRERTFHMEHHFPFFVKPDTVKQLFHLDLFSRTSLGNGFYRYSDAQISLTEDYYAGFLTDDRGIRNFTFYRELTNGLFLQARKQAGDRDKGSTLRAIAGLEHRYVHLENEPLKGYLNEVYFRGIAWIGWGSRFQLKARTRLGFIDAGENFLLGGNLLIDLGKAGDIDAELTFFQRQPTLIESRLAVTGGQVWNNTFQNPFYQKLAVEWFIPSLKVKAKGTNYILSDHILYGEDKRPFQLSNTESVLQLGFEKSTTLGPVGADVWLAYQLQSNDALSLPEWMIQLQLYYSGSWFKNNLHTRIGFDYGNTSDYGAVGYFPLTGQFYNREGTISSFHSIDFFAAFRVRTFRAFVKMENLYSFFSDDFFEQITGYPQFEQYFRFGLNMRLYD